MTEANGKLAEALAKAQAEFKPIIKTLRVKFNNTEYKYADLAAVIEATTPALSKNGLAVTQCAEFKDGQFVMHTRLMHVGGGEVSSYWPMPSSGKPQDMGSWASYARRYSLSSILNVASELDDDAQSTNHIKAELDRAQKAPEKPDPKNDKGIWLETGGGAGSMHGTVSAYLDALEKVMKEMDDREMVFDLNVQTLEKIQAKAMRAKEDAIVKRISSIFDNIQKAA